MFVPPNFAYALFLVSLGTYNGRKRKQKQCLCKIWGDKQRVLWYFPNCPIALALRARAILLVFEKFTRAYLSQIALEIM